MKPRAPKRLAADIRRAITMGHRAAAKMTAAIQRAQTECKHKNVVITANYYGGSYAYDYDDWTAETRMCLICGSREFHGRGEKFEKLFYPWARLSLTKAEQQESLLAHHRWHTVSLDKLVKFVKEKGWLTIKENFGPEYTVR